MSELQLPKLNKNALRIGYYSDKYFIRTQEILIKDEYDHKVDYQYFPRKDVILCGINHVIDVFKNCTGYYKNREKAWNDFNKMQNIDIYNHINLKRNLSIFNQLILKLEDNWVNKFDEIELWYMEEGSYIKNMNPVLGITGNPKYFAHLETPTLGILAQQSAVATSVREVVKRLKPNQELLFFPARFRHYVSQSPDGYAASIGGAKLMSTDSNYEYWGYSGIGTIPHLLIAAYEGCTAKAALKFNQYIDPKINRVILVDWDNDCIKTTLEVIYLFLANKTGLVEYSIKTIKYLTLNSLIKLFEKNKKFINSIIGEGKDKIYGVRFDTSGSLIDKSVSKLNCNFGVCPELVFKAREVFDSIGLENLKIVVSGGFDIDKIELFQKMNAPVDSFGIGSSIVNKFSVDFTADAVTLDGKENAKVGRYLMNWSGMNYYKI